MGVVKIPTSGRRLEIDNGGNGITLHMSGKVDAHIQKQTSNRSLWIIDAIEDLLEVVSKYILPNLPPPTKKDRFITTISKPEYETLEDIYNLIKEENLFFSRSELIRVAVFLKIMFSSMASKEKTKKLRKKKKKNIIPPEPTVRVPTVRVPTGIDDEGDTKYKVYKILKNVEF